ncbi:hypothetical protein Tco_0282597, partial [Tanacetum coccineum]
MDKDAAVGFDLSLSSLYVISRLALLFTPPTVTIKAKIDVVKEICEALTPTQFEIFEKTCFGHWLNLITLEGTVATLTETVSTLHGTIGTLESRLLTLEGDARVSTLTQTVSSLQCTINTLESRLLALEGDERDFRVVLDGDIAAYMSSGPSYTSPA